MKGLPVVLSSTFVPEHLILPGKIFDYETHLHQRVENLDHQDFHERLYQKRLQQVGELFFSQFFVPRTRRVPHQHRPAALWS